MEEEVVEVVAHTAYKVQAAYMEQEESGVRTGVSVPVACTGVMEAELHTVQLEDTQLYR